VNHQERSLPGRILALDLGKRRIGLALSDELGLTAQGLGTLERTNIREDLAKLSRLAGERGVTLFLIGNPMQMNGSEGPQSAWVREFADRLQARSGLAVKLWDERLTTVEAERVLRESGAGRDERRRAVDRLAAVIILEGYLESHSATSAPGDGPG
jgi:putative Holliday junction resolvase